MSRHNHSQNVTPLKPSFRRLDLGDRPYVNFLPRICESLRRPFRGRNRDCNTTEADFHLYRTSKCFPREARCQRRCPILSGSPELDQLALPQGMPLCIACYKIFYLFKYSTPVSSTTRYEILGNWDLAECHKKITDERAGCWCCPSYRRQGRCYSSYQEDQAPTTPRTIHQQDHLWRKQVDQKVSAHGWLETGNYAYPNPGHTRESSAALPSWDTDLISALKYQRRTPQRRSSAEKRRRRQLLRRTSDLVHKAEMVLLATHE